MLLSWREQVVVAVAPGVVQLARRVRGWRGGRAAVEQFRCAMGDGDHDWKPPLAAAKEGLRRLGRARSALSIVLSGSYARYQSVPWHDRMCSPADRLRLARAQFRAAYGDVADEWAVCLDRVGYGRAVLACAVDQALLDALQALSSGPRLRIASVRPHLAEVLRLVRDGLPRGDFRFALIERGRLWLGRHGRGGWTDVSNCRLARQQADEVLTCIARAHAGSVPQSVPTYFAATGLDHGGLRTLRDAGLTLLAARTDGLLGAGVGSDAAIRP